MTDDAPVEPSQERQVTLEEALLVARECQRNGKLDEAADIYRRVLLAVPDQPDALHYAGVLAHQQGRSDDAMRLVERSLQLEPGNADWHNNLGIILKGLGRLDEATAAYERALALAPGHANALTNLGVTLRALGRLDQAEQAYRRAIARHPTHADAHHNLGVTLSHAGRLREAVECYCRALTLRPRQPETYRLLVAAHCMLGERDQAVDVVKEWLRHEPDDPSAHHILAACSGQDVPSRASDAYVEQVFDGFARTFDAKLANLSYQAPQLVAAVLADTGLEPAGGLDILDAGCGTGLCGPLVAPWARHLAGVDLSSGMLDLARRRCVYQELTKGELTAYLRSHPGAFDLIISADTLVYFGALDEVLSAAGRALRVDGALIFTLEELAVTSEASGVEHRIEPHGRYAHARGHIERVLDTVGLRYEIVRAELRLEGGVPVAGLVIRADKGRGLQALARDRMTPPAAHLRAPGGQHA